LPADTAALLASKEFADFPHLATARTPSAAQVNLLAHLAAWTITNPLGRQHIQERLDLVRLPATVR
jgi:hypothetical protein